eukprot:TRINITY_DN779800_c0_g1_i1.p1 TRINITY_DN779800_c0_g1~~TRINITY_DN779800_c0_g1_i1.p1  ORF type:complete len:460 (-),score=88.96 TRINITY_DN779800_c0_g1_i1:204-1583(-)
MVKIDRSLEEEADGGITELAQGSTTKPFVEEDSFIALLYKPHTIIGLVVLIPLIVYATFFREPQESNVIFGLCCAAGFFLYYCMIQMRDSILLRPHPAFWRINHGQGILYACIMLFFLTQSATDVRGYMKLIDPELGEPLIEREYGDDCRLYTPDIEEGHPFGPIRTNIFDFFIFAHAAGFWGKSLILRNVVLMWVFSVFFEVLEVSLMHIMPNFNECWWDHMILDVFGCNFLGIILGMGTVALFEARTYDWKKVTDIKGGFKKMKRIAMQFSPLNWVKYEWNSVMSAKRLLQIMFMVLVIEAGEVTAFSMKTVLWIPSSHWLNILRVWVIGWIANHGVAEYYEFITNSRCKRLGPNAWLGMIIIIMEVLLSIKFGEGQFGPIKPPTTVAVCWIITLALLFVFIVLYSLRKTLPKLGLTDTVSKCLVKLSFFAIPLPLVVLLLMDCYRTYGCYPCEKSL